jgi:hypothetical protein
VFDFAFYGVMTALNMACGDYVAYAALKNNNYTGISLLFFWAGFAAVGNSFGNGALQPLLDSLVYLDMDVFQLVS